MHFIYSTVKSLMVVLILGGMASKALGQQKELPVQPKPLRIITIQGQVTLPEGTPAGRAVVTLTTTSNGIPRQAYTNEQGKFEFPGIEEGGYTLTAKSVSDPGLASESVEADTYRTATTDLRVNLVLRREANAAGNSKPEVVTAVDSGQHVPKEARKAFREGLKFRRESEAVKALEKLNRAVELYPEYYQALAERGDLLIFERKLAEAALDFERALKINSRYGPALRGMGYCKLEEREFDEAAGYLEKAITAQPDNANTYLLLGIAYLELDRREPARLALFKALSFNSQHELRAYIYLGNLYARERMYKEAAEELAMYLEANPTAADAAEIKAIEAQWRARAGESGGAATTTAPSP
jgi:tetratricopeptide (TPR) repeat protein